MAERGGVEVAELGERERGGCEGEADVRVRELPAQPVPAGEDDLVVVERERWQVVDGVPRRVLGQLRVDAGGHDPEERGRELAALGVAAGLAPRAELLEVRDVAHVDLGGQVAADRPLERLVRLERAARQRPRAR